MLCVVQHQCTDRLRRCLSKTTPEKSLFTHYLMYIPLDHITNIFHSMRTVGSSSPFVYSSILSKRKVLGTKVVFIQLIILGNVPYGPCDQYTMTLKLQTIVWRSYLTKLDIILSLSNKVGCLRGAVPWGLPPIVNVLHPKHLCWYYLHCMIIPC